jgi:hypothetical protein
MVWIKRNLFFVLGSLVALGLMGVGVFYLLSQISEEQRLANLIQQDYQTLTTLTTQKPHPGAGSIDNIAAAKEQAAKLREYIGRTGKVFQRIPPIPDSPPNRISSRDFANQLVNTISQLRRDAERQGVALSTTNYDFTFHSQMQALNFDPASLGPLAVHLGEVKALAEVLFDAEINSLDSIRREAITSANDDNPPDYLASNQKTITNTLAELTPYELTFKCFSRELAQVLAGLAGSPHGFIVKTINIVPTEANNMPDDNMTTPTPRPTRRPIMNRSGEGGRQIFQPVPPPVTMAPASAPPHGSPVFLNEKPVRVTLMVQVVKLRQAAK